MSYSQEILVYYKCTCNSQDYVTNTFHVIWCSNNPSCFYSPQIIDIGKFCDNLWFKIYNEKVAFFQKHVIKIALFSSTDYNIPVTRPSGLYNVYLLRYCTVHRGKICHFYVRFTIATEVNLPDKKLVKSTFVQWL